MMIRSSSNHQYSLACLTPSLDFTSLWKLFPSAAVAALLISLALSLLPISSIISPVPFTRRTLPVSSSNSLLITDCCLSHSSFVMGALFFLSSSIAVFLDLALASNSATEAANSSTLDFFFFFLDFFFLGLGESTESSLSLLESFRFFFFFDFFSFFDFLCF